MKTQIRIVALPLILSVNLASVTCCATHGQPPPDFTLDDSVAAHALAEPPKPIEVVEVPKLLPLPKQLKSLRNAPEDKTVAESLDEKTRVARANAKATVRWIVGDTTSGAGTNQRVNILVKPTRIGLKTNLVITTNRRTYLLELSSTPQAWMASASWDYPKDRLLALQKQAQQAQTAAPVDSGLSLEQIKFRYAISGDSPPWKPLRAFDDGKRVYIQFPAGIAQGELPPLFVIGAQGDGQLVNYRFRSPYYVVDRLFGAAELRLGADKAVVVRIERTDGVGSPARRH
ncbi:MAG: P-type conjugative transfer protein TrbG [Polaromonas sp.]|uniref:P-type conjugative transfer protein TrbG n=1 Tax=Polaromonas sp. TaxID=1869339 RepID=UPI00185BB58D|nr:P-type conjugative transfer protein TrbG [Polaromonas sp.]NMM09159.1 P-type conjugative transfer protein TrbG [Polaromonas sp.]